MQKPRSSIIMLIIIVSVLLAAASSLILLNLQNRPDAPEEPAAAEGQAPAETQVVNIEGVDVAINRNLDNVLLLLPAAPQPENAQPEQPAQDEQQNQEQPEQPAQDGQQTQEQPAEQPTVATQEQPAQPTAVPVNTANQAVDSIIYQGYTVQENDSLYNITRQLNTSITLMAVKGVDQDDLVAGTVIQVPVGNPAYCPGLQPYAVGEGDTVFSIAQRRNTTPENLQAINKLDANYTIFSGTIICVP